MNSKCSLRGGSEHLESFAHTNSCSKFRWQITLNGPALCLSTASAERRRGGGDFETLYCEGDLVSGGFQREIHMDGIKRKVD